MKITIQQYLLKTAIQTLLCTGDSNRYLLKIDNNKCYPLKIANNYCYLLKIAIRPLLRSENDRATIQHHYLLKIYITSLSTEDINSYLLKIGKKMLSLLSSEDSKITINWRYQDNNFIYKTSYTSRCIVSYYYAFGHDINILPPVFKKFIRIYLKCVYTTNWYGHFAVHFPFRIIIICV